MPDPHPAPVVVGAPMLPDPKRLSDLMCEALASGWLTNCGVLHDRLERALFKLSGTPNLALVSSGTMALMVALRLGNLPEGAEVITSPLSFAASVQAIAWCGFRPVFADVDPETLTLCPRAVEAAITPRTAAILPVHWMGVPCDVIALDLVAKQHRLWLAYDAAHAFGVTLNGQPIAEFGDASAFSLHATKVLHTCEGGFVTTRHKRSADLIAQMRNFGLRAGHMEATGINGKLSEMHAAMGLALLPDLPAEIAARESLRQRFDAAFSGLGRIVPLTTRAGASNSLTFYGLRTSPETRRQLVGDLAAAGIRARDHFPLLCGQGTANADAKIVAAGEAPVAPRIGPELLCLPFHGRVSQRDVDLITSIVRRRAEGLGGRD